MRLNSRRSLLRYFTMADEDLPPSYVKSCKKFLDSICWPSYYGGTNTNGKIYKLNKPQASSCKRHETDTIKK